MGITRSSIICAAFLMIFAALPLGAQEQFPWPITPLFESHIITGNFSEYRSTSTDGHYHNGTDIPKPDLSPVVAVKSGTVSSLSSVGSSAYVRVNDLAYVHILPHPALSIGDPVVASETILGTILPGLGHVHFTNGFVGSEQNSMLPGSGLTPFVDEWPPEIVFIRFFQNNTTLEFADNVISGPVDIVVKADEKNGPADSSSAVHNNGIYKIGYKILSADTSTIVFEPPDDGIRFQFDSKPSNTYVNTVYFQSLSSTTSHVYQVTNNYTSDAFWNTGLYEPGNYVVMAFVEDTRANTDTAYALVTVAESDVQAPAPPTLKYLRETASGMELSWLPNSEDDLIGYRLYFSFDNEAWSLFSDEEELPSTATSTSIAQILGQDVYFRLSAVDGAPIPNESGFSDVYGMSNGDFLHKVLLVDGFDRVDGGWTAPSHGFAFDYGRPVIANNISFDTYANEAVEAGEVDLLTYEALIWFIGDESPEGETFSSAEQTVLSNYLENGGFLFVSGAQIARDLDLDAGSGSEADDAFLHEFLRTDYAGINSSSSAADGIDGGIFSGLSVAFGLQPYTIGSSDFIAPFGDNTAAGLLYDEGPVAAVNFAGTMGQGTVAGKIIYLAFPFETIDGAENRQTLMTQVLDFFFDIVGIADSGSGISGGFELQQNYPNPFNPETHFGFRIADFGFVNISIFDISGRLVKTAVSKNMATGSYTAQWDGTDQSGLPVASGVYFYRLVVKSAISDQQPAMEQSRKMILLR